MLALESNYTGDFPPKPCDVVRLVRAMAPANSNESTAPVTEKEEALLVGTMLLFSIPVTWFIIAPAIKWMLLGIYAVLGVLL